MLGTDVDGSNDDEAAANDPSEQGCMRYPQPFMRCQPRPSGPMMSEGTMCELIAELESRSAAVASGAANQNPSQLTTSFTSLGLQP
jgi:hypothetical protein